MLLKMKLGLAFWQKKRYFNYRKRLSPFAVQNSWFFPTGSLNRFRIRVLYGTFPLGNSQGNLQIIKNTYF
jgi:hypothetical protein